MLADLDFARDPDGHLTVTGSHLGGALRSALADRLGGFRTDETEALQTLFGWRLDGDAKIPDHAAGSRVTIYPMQSTTPPTYGVRDGLKIDPATGLAEKGAKYDYEVAHAGLEFPFLIELDIFETDDENTLLQTFAQTLSCLEEGIPLGVGKRTGSGLLIAKNGSMKVKRFKLADKTDIRAFAASPPKLGLPTEPGPPPKSFRKAISAQCHKCGLGSLGEAPEDRRDLLIIKFDVEVIHTLLIGEPVSQGAVDKRSLMESTRRLLPGKSIKGRIKSQAQRVLLTLGWSEKDTEDQLEALFGSTEAGGRFRPKEATLTGSTYEQTKIVIDRFLGGTVHGMKLDLEPVVGGKVENFVVTVENPSDREIGLLINVARDLQERRLTFGAMASVGKGVLAGKITFQRNGAQNPFATVTVETDGFARIDGETTDYFKALLPPRKENADG